MDIHGFTQIVQSIYHHISGSSLSLKDHISDASDQESALYLAFLAGKKAEQAYVIGHIAGAYGISLYHENIEPIADIRESLPLEEKDLPGIYEHIRFSSETDLNNYSLLLALNDNRKIFAFIIAVMDFERDFMLDAQAGYAHFLSCQNLQHPYLKDSVREMQPSFSEMCRS